MSTARGASVGSTDRGGDHTPSHGRFRAGKGLLPREEQGTCCPESTSLSWPHPDPDRAWTAQSPANRHPVRICPALTSRRLLSLVFKLHFRNVNVFSKPHVWLRRGGTVGRLLRGHRAQGTPLRAQ